MKDQVKSYIYRGIKYTSEQLANLQKSSTYVGRELKYRGTRYIDTVSEHFNSKSVKKTYRGVTYY